jgi:FAD/FMN-containing dehydrogenase
LAVVPQGGNTGLVGGSVPVFDEVVVSTKNMNKIVKFDETSSVLTVEAGVVLEKANEHLSKFGCQVPLDLGAKGSCQLGGNASTNAGGIYMVKHGSFRSHILGMEAVLPNGTILNMES